MYYHAASGLLQSKKPRKQIAEMTQGAARKEINHRLRNFMLEAEDIIAQLEGTVPF